jgi:hypothetical protein
MPYKTARTMAAEDAAYLAGLIDGTHYSGGGETAAAPVVTISSTNELLLGTLPPGGKITRAHRVEQTFAWIHVCCTTVAPPFWSRCRRTFGPKGIRANH